MKSRLRTTTALVVALAASAAVLTANLAIAEPQGSTMTTTTSGLQYEDTVVGTGATPETGQTCVVHYTGLALSGRQEGREVRLVARSRQTVRVPHRHRASHQGVGRRRGDDEGRWKANPYYSARTGLWRARRRRRDPTECHVDV